MKALRTVRVMAAGLALVSGVAPAAAQDAAGQAAGQADRIRDASAVEALEAARAAIRELDNIAVEVDRTMVVIDDELDPANAMITSIKLNSRGTLRGTRDEDGAWTYRIDGFADNIGQPDAFQLSIVREPSVVSWLNYNQEKKYVSRPRLARGEFISSEDSVSPALWFQDPPLAKELGADSLRTLSPEQVDGVLCDVVEIRYADRERMLPARLFIDRETGLIRRAVRVLVPGYEEVTNVVSIDTETAHDADRLALPLPEGWTAVYQPATLDPARSADTREVQIPAGELPTARPRETGGQVGEIMPAFTGVTMLGEDISSEALLGSPAVLVFWSSWIPSAATAVQDIAALREAYGDSIGMLTFTIRERNPDAALNLLLESGLDEVPLVIEGREAIVGMDVLRAPTFLVVDPSGEIVYRSNAYEAGTTITEVRGALDAALAD
ncbi:MAG: TlpA disulfide reductase family protein [Planctomycetota bacterium]